MKNILAIAIASLYLAGCGEDENKNRGIGVNQVYAGQVAQNKLSDKEIKKFSTRCTRFFDSLLVDKGFNGSILVAKNGIIVYEKYAGFIDPVQKKDTFTQSSAFHLASVSKTFTAMGILKLKEEGKLQLEDTLGKFFPGFLYPAVTVKMLLTHRSGLPNYTYYFEAHKWDKKQMVSNQDVLTSFSMMRPGLESTPGRRFAYCNTNYALLALIIEQVSGKTYPEYMKETFFLPLGMNDSYVYTPADAERAMPSFEWNNRKYSIEFLDDVYGDKNIYSTVRDMLKWDQALYEGKLFTQPTLDSAFTPYSNEKPGKRNYGLGWRMTLLDNGKKLIYHNGWWHGNNTVFIRLLDEQATVIVLGNKFNRRIYSAKNVCDVFGTYLQHKEPDET